MAGVLRGNLFMAGMSEAAYAPVCFNEIINHLEIRLNNRHNHKLRNTVTHFDGETITAAIPAGDKQLPLIIWINQADQIPQHNTMFVTQTRAWQNNCRHVRI